MKRFLSAHYSAGAFNTATLLLRIVAGVLLIVHGYDKLVHFEEQSAGFHSVFGLSPKISFALLVFAEFFCSFLVIIGLFTRLACIPVIIAMAVAFIQVHHMTISDFKEAHGGGQPSALFLGCYLVLLLLGAGKVSVDSMISK